VFIEYDFRMSANTQFIVDAQGERTAVILPISEYEELLEDLDDLAAVAERSNEPTTPLSEVISRLKRDGKLPN
jgi:tetrahydromethanopterin S-methyltransferase subunit B